MGGGKQQACGGAGRFSCSSSQPQQTGLPTTRMLRTRAKRPAVQAQGVPPPRRRAWRKTGAGVMNMWEPSPKVRAFHSPSSTPKGQASKCGCEGIGIKGGRPGDAAQSTQRPAFPRDSRSHGPGALLRQPCSEPLNGSDLAQSPHHTTCTLSLRSAATEGISSHIRRERFTTHGTHGEQEHLLAESHPRLHDPNREQGEEPVAALRQALPHWPPQSG